MDEELDWVSGWPFGKQCRARITPNETGSYGRCELKPHSKDVEHALERGMVWVRWFDSTIRFEEPHYG